jgi:hypothetical protein
MPNGIATLAMGMPLSPRMRAIPSLTRVGEMRIYDGIATAAITTIDYVANLQSSIELNVSCSGGSLSPGRPAAVYRFNNAYLDLSAEL